MGLLVTDNIESSFFPNFATYKCKHCHTHIFSQAWIIPGEFSGRTGDAFFINKAINCIVGKSPFYKHFRTGIFKIAYVHCLGCKQYLGWKYLVAQRSCEKYKVGKLVIEKSKIVKKEDRFQDSLFDDETIKKQSKEVQENIRRQPVFFQYIYKIFLQQFDNLNNDDGDPIVTQFYNFITILNLKIKNFDTDDDLLNLLSANTQDIDASNNTENSNFIKDLNNLSSDDILSLENNSRKKSFIFNLIIKNYKCGVDYSTHPAFLKFKKFYDDIIILNSPKFLVFKDQFVYFELNKMHPVLNFQSFVSSIKKDKKIRERLFKNRLNNNYHRHAIYKNDYQNDNNETDDEINENYFENDDDDDDDDDYEDDDDSFTQTNSLFWNFSNFNLPVSNSPMINYLFLDSTTGRLKFNSWILDADNNGTSTQFLSFKNKIEKKNFEKNDDDLYDDSYSISYGSTTSNNSNNNSFQSNSTSSSLSSSSSSYTNNHNIRSLPRRYSNSSTGTNTYHGLSSNDLESEESSLRNNNFSTISNGQNSQLQRHYRVESENIRSSRIARSSGRELSVNFLSDNDDNDENSRDSFENSLNANPSPAVMISPSNHYHRYRTALSRRRHRRRAERLLQQSNTQPNNSNFSFFHHSLSSPPRSNYSLRNSTNSLPSIPTSADFNRTSRHHSTSDDNDEDEEMYDFEEDQQISSSRELDTDQASNWLTHSEDILERRRMNLRSSNAGLVFRVSSSDAHGNRFSLITTSNPQNLSLVQNENQSNFDDAIIEENDGDDSAAGIVEDQNPRTNTNSDASVIPSRVTHAFAADSGDILFEEESTASYET